jgi:Fe-S oxidoreductase
MHLTIFWGMMALVLGTALATIDWDVTRLFFDFQFLTGGIYVAYELVLDVLGLSLLVGLGMAVYRRYVSRPDRLGSVSSGEERLQKNLAVDDAYVLIMLALIAISGYLVEGLRIAVVQPDWAPWSPIGNAISKAFLALGDPTNRTLHTVIWIGHGMIAFISIASIPFTKLFHAVAAPVNIFFRSLKPPGRLPPAEFGAWVGVRGWQDFTWNQLLGIEACTRCGRCQEDCPAHISGLALSPRDIMVKLDALMRARENGRDLHGDVITAEELWACTSCHACVQNCPVFIDQLSPIVDMRRYLVNEGLIDGQLQDALANLGRYGNSFGKSDRMRARWTKGVQPKIKDVRKEPARYLWFVGDYASYHDGLAEITGKTAKVFEKIGLDFGILYEGERNSGNDVRRVGEEGLFEMLVEKNLSALSKADYGAIVTTDPHSYNTLKNEYPPETYAGRPILHYSELLDRLISNGQLRFSQKLDYKVTYHDPCYLGRYNGVYDAPRRVIEATGCQLVEMPRHGEKALCCGAGGGRIWMDEAEVEERPSEARIHEAMSLAGVDAFVVACPKDVTMYQDAVKTTGYQDDLAILDLIDLAHEAM